MIEFNCPSCQAAIRVKDEMAGHQGKCPTCGNVITVPIATTGQAPPVFAMPQTVQANDCWKTDVWSCPAIVGLILSPIMPIIGAAFCIWGLMEIKQNKANRGKGLAIAGLVLNGVVIVAILMLLSSLGRVRGPARRAICGANLNAIGKGMAMYCAVNDEAYPQTVEQLLESGEIGERMLQCPSDDDPERDYFICFPTDRNAPSKRIIACDHASNHDDYRNVLYASMGVTGMTEAAFQAALKEPVNAEFAEAYRKAGSP